MDAIELQRRARRSFTGEYKGEVVELCRASGKSIAAVARDPDLSETAVRRSGHPGRGRRGPPGRPLQRRSRGARHPAPSDDARAILEVTTGVAMLPVFPPPYGAYDAGVLAVAQASGFPTVLLWDTSDADTSTQATPAQLVEAAMRGTNGSVLLTHGGPALTPRSSRP